jgi:hypothetical protein
VVSRGRESTTNLDGVHPELNAGESGVQCSDFTVGDDAQWASAVESSGDAEATAEREAHSDPFFCNADPETASLPSFPVTAMSESGSSNAFGSGSSTRDDHPSSTRFALLLGDSAQVDIDLSCSLSRWALSLRTTDATLFRSLSDCREQISAALAARFSTDVTIRVDPS